MISTKIKSCECGYTGKFFGKKCGVCRQKQYDAKRLENKKPTGELELFLEIWNERPHKSEVSGEPLYYFDVSNFSHVLPKAKGKYPKMKLYKKNIMLKTREEHDLWEYHKYKIVDDPKWKKVFELANELKIEYKYL